MNEALPDKKSQEPLTSDGFIDFFNFKTRSDYETGSKIKRTRSKKESSHEQLIFDFESALLRGNLSGRIFGAIDYGETIGGISDNGQSGQSTILADIRGIDKDNSNGIFGESQSFEISGDTSQRNSFSASSLPSLINYRLTEENFSLKGGSKTKYKNNIEAIKLVYELEKTEMTANKEQQAVLAKYAGWGGMSQVFDQYNEDWQNEYKELKNLLRPEDYRKANESILSSFYTSKTVVDGVYEGLKQLGFNSGTVLEPAMGTGNFVGLIPKDFNTKVYGVELDNITGRIAKHLYPQATIKVQGFEETHYPDGFFDSVFTNVPFGAYKVFDEKYSKYDLFIHDYFILKSLDKLRAGGVAAFVTSKGTLDKARSYPRKLFSDRADFLGAIRLPNNAFKETANTEVTSDILFFKKKAVSEWNDEASWIQTAENENGIEINKYFIEHPEMILGIMKKGKSMYGGEDETYCEPDGRDLKEALREAVKRLPSNIYEHGEVKVTDTPRLLADFHTIRNYCYGVLNDNIYLRVDSELIPQSVSYSNRSRLKAMIEMRELLRYLLDLQIEGCTDIMLEDTQERLNRMYDSFVRRFGYINSKINKNIFRDDADFTLLLSLENYDQSSGRATKTDIFTKRTIRKYVRPEKADTALEALYISKNETGKVDLRIIESLTGKSLDEITAELDGQIYRNPYAIIRADKYSGWETASEYLSGNVRQKLETAKTATAEFPELEKNIEALTKVQPTPLTASEIHVRAGVSWIKPEIYKQFLLEKFNAHPYVRNSINVEFNRFTKEWTVDAPPNARSFESQTTFGTTRINGYNLYEHALNLRIPSVYDTEKDEDGKDKRVLNKPETILAREKLRKIQEEFKAWIFDEPKRRNELVEVYNEKFNNLVLPTYDGSYMTFPEMNPLIELRQHQKDAVERIITSGNTLLHHVVGSGKTFTVAAAAIRLRQLKLAQKPMIVVPNHLVMQWANEFRTLYPNAKLLIATKKDFEKVNRLRFTSRIATGDWDAVIISMSSFEKLPISKERQERKIQEEIDSIQTAIIDLNKNKDSRTTVKILQRVLKNKETTLKELSSTKKDNLIKFEDLGVDYLFVDEADKYKNKFIFTKMNNVSGISRAMSKRATDLDMKIDYISELHGGQKGTVFATGTPISNSMTEMYTMQSYLHKDDLQAAGLRFFDDWAATFGETQTALELAPSGQGYRSKTRFAKFVNLPELLKMYRSFADVKTQEMLNLPIPKANKHIINLKPTDELLRLNEIIAERAEKIANRQVQPEEDNMLKITSDGKKLALDPRCFDGDSYDDPDYKVNICAENIHRIWEQTKTKRSTQLVFCDLSTPKKAFEDYNPKKDFDVYNHLKTVLTDMGIPPKEIAYIHEAKTDIEKQSIFDNVRSGKVRVLIGSTEKCGAGTNVQDKLIALHHLDTPYRPRDLEQRNGRGERQGNENEEIDIFTYVTERSFDAYSYQILETKQRFISQINRGELSVREAADIDEATLTYAEIKAITSANPLIKRKLEVENELSQLRVLQSQYKTNRYNLQDSISALPATIENIKKKISDYKQDILLRDENSSPDFFMLINGKPYTERKEAVEQLHKYIGNVNAGKRIAILKGFDIIPEQTTSLTDTYVQLKGNGTYRVQVSESASGTLVRLENFLEKMEESLKSSEVTLMSREAELISAKAELDKPFEHEQKILDLTGELAEIDAKLDLNKEEIAVIDDEKFQSEKEVIAIDGDESDEEDDDYSDNSIFENTTDYSPAAKSDFAM